MPRFIIALLIYYYLLVIATSISTRAVATIGQMGQFPLRQSKLPHQSYGIIKQNNYFEVKTYIETLQIFNYN